MAGLIGGLINGSRALAAHQAGVQVAGRNLANVNTPGYARQRVILGDKAVVEGPLGPAGTGVEALGVKQIRDRFLDAQVTRELSQSALLTAQESAFAKAEGSLGEQIDRTGGSASISTAGGSSTGLSSALNDFFNGFDNLAANPSDAGAKQVLLQRADQLVSKFNVSDQRLSQLQSDLTAQIETDTATVNGLLSEIAKLNGEIAQSEFRSPDSAVDLRDQRQSRLEELAQYLDFEAAPIEGSRGQLQLTTRDASGAAAVLVDKVTVTGKLSFDGTQFTAGTSAIPLAPRGGALLGNLAARDGAVQQLRDDLKRTAEQMASAVNTAYNPTGTTDNFFAAAPASGIIGRDPSLNISTLKSSDTGLAGANELALAVAGVAQQTFSTGAGDAINGTIGSFYNQTVSGFAENLSGVRTSLGDQTIVAGMVTQQRDAVSGVSLDEEVADLMRFQRAFQASARVINVIDSMLETLVTGLGR